MDVVRSSEVSVDVTGLHGVTSLKTTFFTEVMFD
jgi:hypothetical protein